MSVVGILDDILQNQIKEAMREKGLLIFFRATFVLP